MKIKNTQAELDAIGKALDLMHVRRFDCKSCDPKYNAQRNLSGLTHYVDDDTLRFHHSKVLRTYHAAGGLAFVIVHSDAADMHNTKRGFRVCVFDCFGNTLFRPELDAMKSSSKAALKAFEAEEFDLVAHYKATLKGQEYETTQKLAEVTQAMAILK